MLKIIICLSTMMFHYGIFVFGQTESASDSLRLEIKNQNGDEVLNTCIISSFLISYGISTRLLPDLQELDISIHEDVSRYSFERTAIDDYLQYSPILGIYGLDLLGIKAENSIKNRTLLLGCSYLMLTGVIQGSKRISKIKRPDSSARTSFPSGHTATAFVGAHTLFKEYRDTPLIWISGYLISTTTGAFRITNKRHWFSDVITGAGIGILCTEFIYYLLPKIILKTEKNYSAKMIPDIQKHYLGMTFSYSF